jgi:outer membrane lipoprotein-sorting protein
MKGTIEFGEQSMPIDIYAKEPDRRITFTHTPNGDSVTAFDGHEGWLVSSGHPPHFMQGSEIDAASIDADLHLATHLPQMFSAMKVEGTEKIGDREAYIVVGERQGKTPLRLYFDEQTGLLLRLVRFGETAVGWLPTQIDYADYREANGIKVPYRWILARPNGRFTIQLTDLKQNVPVDDAKFAKPAQEPPKPPTK